MQSFHSTLMKGEHIGFGSEGCLSDLTWNSDFRGCFWWHSWPWTWNIRLCSVVWMERTTVAKPDRWMQRVSREKKFGSLRMPQWVSKSYVSRNETAEKMTDRQKNNMPVFVPNWAHLLWKATLCGRKLLLKMVASNDNERADNTCKTF